MSNYTTILKQKIALSSFVVYAIFLRMYYRCKLLDSGVVEFGYYGVNLCNQCAHAGGGNIRCAVYDDTEPQKFKFDIEKFIDKKKEVFSKFANGECYPPCEGCIFLHKSSVRPELINEIFDNFILHYWTKCNSHCIYCYTNKDKQYFNARINYKLYPILKYMDRNGYIGYQGFVDFAGGEVSCLSEFSKVLNIFRKYDYFILFNSSAVQYEKSIATELEHMRAMLIVSVDSGCEETFRKIKQVDTYKNVWQNLKKYVAKSALADLVFSKYIFIENVNCNKEEIKKFLQKSQKIGIKNVIFDIDWNWLKFRKESIDSAVIQLFYFAFEEAKSMGINLLLYDNAAVLFSDGEYKDDFWLPYIFTYNDDYSGPRFKKVLCFDSKTHLETTYSNIKDAANDAGLDYKKVKIACEFAKRGMPIGIDNKFFVYQKDYKNGSENALSFKYNPINNFVFTCFEYVRNFILKY